MENTIHKLGQSPERFSTNIIQAIQQLLDDNRNNLLKNYLDCSDACMYLGVAKSYLYKLTNGKKIPYFKTGKKIYFKREDLEEYITKYRFSSQDELIAMARNYSSNKN